MWWLVFLFAEEMFILDSTRGRNFISDSVRRLPLFEYEEDIVPFTMLVRHRNRNRKI